MSAQIELRPSGAAAWRVEVCEGGSRTVHEVTVSAEELERFGGGAGAEALIRESFCFLLEREPKESILERFGLGVIARYFPDYPAAIRRRLQRP